jgi:HEPN domain-containing protein
MPTRNEFQVLSEARLSAIKNLFAGGLYDIVCQDSGYVVEFGLKSAICKAINTERYPDNKKIYRTHNLTQLVKLARLENDLNEKKVNDAKFFANWSLVSKWSVNMRYQPIGENEEENAKDHINAIENPKDGVHPWIKQNW